MNTLRKLYSIILTISCISCYQTESNAQVNGAINDCFFMEDARVEVGKLTIRNLLKPKLVNGKYGYVDTFGNMIIQPIFDFAVKFNVDSTAVIGINDHYGVINLNGDYIINPTFDCLTNFGNGFVSVKQNNKWGLCFKGKPMLKTNFDAISFFYPFLNDTMVKVKVNNLFGLYSINGHEILPIKYREIERVFEKTFMLTEMDAKYNKKTFYYFLTSKNILSSDINYLANSWDAKSIFNKIGLQIFHADSITMLVDSNGIVLKKYPKEIQIFRSLIDYGLQPIKINNKIGHINEKGEIVTESIFDEDNSDWLFDRIRVKYKDKFGFLGHDGKYIIKPNYKALNSSFIASYVAYSNNGKWGLINIHEKIVLQPIYDEIHYLGNELYNLKSGNDNWLMNNKCKIVTSKPYSSISHANKTILPYLLVFQNELRGCIDTFGREVIPLTDKYKSLFENLIIIEKNNKWGMSNSKNEIVIPCIYDSICTFNFWGTPIKYNGKWGLVNEYFSTLIDFKYDEMEIYDGGYNGIKYKVKLNNEVYWIDKQEKLIKK